MDARDERRLVRERALDRRARGRSARVSEAFGADGAVPDLAAGRADGICGVRGFLRPAGAGLGGRCTATARPRGSVTRRALAAAVASRRRRCGARNTARGCRRAGARTGPTSRGRLDRRVAAVARDSEPFLRLGLVSPEWLDAALPRLVDAWKATPIDGGALLHGDVRSD